jgi:hypothetical protein
MMPPDTDRQAIAAYVEQMAAILDLPLPPDCRDGVIDNVQRTRAIAQLVLEFPLPPDIEVAPTFEP